MSSLFKNLPHEKELKDKMLETKEKVRAPMTSHKGGTEKSEQFLSKFNVGKDLSLGEIVHCNGVNRVHLLRDYSV